MKVLITGANGYIGTRLTPVLIEEGHEVYALTRNPERVPDERVKPIVGDLSDPKLELPKDIDAAYYLVHSMAHNPKNFDKVDRKVAENFVQAIEKTRCQQIIYLSGLINDQNLSKHLSSRHEVETILSHCSVPLTTLRAAVIIGSGSASFEIIRDLVEKLPIMVAPKWVSKKCQPIAIADVIDYLSKVLGNHQCYNQSFDIGGPDILTYREMLLKLAKMRKLKRLIIPVPFFSPRLSSYWLFFITSTSYYLARSLVDSLKNNAVCKNSAIQKIIPKKCLSYDEAIQRAFQKIEQNAVLSSWRDSWSYSKLSPDLNRYIEVPKHGCYTFEVKKRFEADPEEVKKSIFNIGGKSGWYSMNWAWRIRGLLDRVVGGVGIRRGRTHKNKLKPGDALDFWRVLLADQVEGRLLLYAEMKIPGEAWLEFKIEHDEEGAYLSEIATFRPNGWGGRFYWWFFYPFHLIIFPGMASHIVNVSKQEKNK